MRLARPFTLALAVVATLTLSVPAAAAPTNAVGSSAAAKLPTVSQLRGARLAPADLPDGYRRDRSRDNTSSTSHSSDPKCSRMLADLEASDGPDAPRSVHSKFHADRDLGPFVGNSIGVWRTGRVPAASLAALRALLRTCPRWTETDTDGTSTTVRLRPLPLPRLGTDRVGLRMRITVHGVIDVYARADLAAVRLGNALTVVSVVSIFAPPDVSLTQLTRTSVTRLKHIL